MRALRGALAKSGFTEPALRERITTLLAHPINATRYYPRGFPGHDTPLDDLIRLLMIGAEVPTDCIERTLDREALHTLIDTQLVSHTGSQLRANVTISLWHELLFVSDREDRLTRVDYVMPPEEPAVWLLEVITKHAPAEPKRVLDIGAGCGTLALLAARTARDVVGIDSNPRAVEFARFNAALNGLSNCTFTHMRAQEVEPSGALFGRITFNCPGLYEVGCLQPEAFSCADGDDLLRAVYGVLPRLLEVDGMALLRHELPTEVGYLHRLLAQPTLRISTTKQPHYAGLRELHTLCAVVTRGLG